ncbi:unnamed protein product [Paramecium sonneborni]|uniref:Uncharacterized protein n=1 Tax=Paramecium sonneborni TaxID=65129 RepID=A0A8S1RWV0_9CILI|nr:unnamed protein product [Paramecium sonneborni]
MKVTENTRRLIIKLKTIKQIQLQQIMNSLTQSEYILLEQHQKTVLHVIKLTLLNQQFIIYCIYIGLKVKLKSTRCFFIIRFCFKQYDKCSRDEKSQQISYSVCCLKIRMELSHQFIEVMDMFYQVNNPRCHCRPK